MHETCPPANDHYVYLHKKASTGEIFYVGAGRKNRSRSKCGRSKFWQATVAKHGLDIELFAVGLSFADSRTLEILTISNLLRVGIRLCNMTAGGEGLNGLKHRDETKVKIAASNIGKNLGKKPSEETRAKLSEARKGRVHSLESRAKMSATQKGRPKKSPPHNKGKPMPEEQRAKLSGIPKSQGHIEAIRAKAVERWAAIPKEDRPKVDNSGENNPRADRHEYLFVCDDGRFFRGTRVAFLAETGLNPKALFRSAPAMNLRGWRYYCS